MKIGVVSDTHSRELPQEMINEFKKVDFIIHAGDFCSLDDLARLTKIKDVQAVYGNMDDSQIREKFPRRQILQCGQFQIGLFHGEGPPNTLLEKVKKEFKEDKVDVVIFGHSHQALNEKSEGVLFFNPGSPNDDIFAPYCSYGILDVNEQGVEGKIVKLKG